MLAPRSEEHTSELQSRQYLVCRLLLEKKKTYCGGSSGITTTQATTRSTSSWWRRFSAGRRSSSSRSTGCGFASTCLFFFLNDTATTEIYTLSLHDALPISIEPARTTLPRCSTTTSRHVRSTRSEEHTSELQSRQYLVCRLLLEKKNTK